jgi:hypothetical protein
VTSSDQEERFENFKKQKKLFVFVFARKQNEKQI